MINDDDSSKIPPLLPSEDNGTLKHKEKRRRWRKDLSTIVIIFVSILTFRSIVFEPFRIPSGSMIPTLMIGDFILVNKFSYGWKIPFSDFFADPIYLFGKSGPKRGDVIVFKYPRDPKVNYIKRVVGLPGDLVEIRNKQLFINDVEVKMLSIPDDKVKWEIGEKFAGYNLKFFRVHTGSHRHAVVLDSDNYYKVNYEKQRIPEGHYFVLGDNRDFSYDSRFWGQVPHHYIKGKAILVWFSMILPIGEKQFKVNPNRIGEDII
jgi:signal peptidase I